MSDDPIGRITGILGTHHDLILELKAQATATEYLLPPLVRQLSLDDRGLPAKLSNGFDAVIGGLPSLPLETRQDLMRLSATSESGCSKCTERSLEPLSSRGAAHEAQASATGDPAGAVRDPRRVCPGAAATSASGRHPGATSFAERAGPCWTMFCVRRRSARLREATADELLGGCSLRQIEMMKGKREAYLVLRGFGERVPKLGRLRRLVRRLRRPDRVDSG